VPEKLRKAIPLGMATIIGVLAVLGVEGELLDRFIRDHPRQVAIALVLGILGVTVPLLVNAWASKKWGQVIGILLVASGAAFATVTGADGVGEREQPDITVTPLAVDADTESVSLKIEALGTHLRSRDRMLLRVSGVSGKDPRAGAPIRVHLLCPDGQSWKNVEDGRQTTVVLDLNRVAVPAAR